MPHLSLVRALSVQRRKLCAYGVVCRRSHPLLKNVNKGRHPFSSLLLRDTVKVVRFGSLYKTAPIYEFGTRPQGIKYGRSISNTSHPCIVQGAAGFCTVARISQDAGSGTLESGNLENSDSESAEFTVSDVPLTNKGHQIPVDFTKVEVNLLPTVILVGRPNVGKSALFNRLIRRREALVYNTPDDHVTRDIREGIAKLGDLRFKVLDSAGLEMAASLGSILDRTADMTANVLARSQFAIFLIDVRHGLHSMDLEVGKWLRKHASGIRTILVMNKSESLDDAVGYLTAAAGEAHKLGYGNPIAISAETGLGMAELYEAPRPLLEDYILKVLNDSFGVAAAAKFFLNYDQDYFPCRRKRGKDYKEGMLPIRPHMS